jgi:hypothetical protein
MQLELLVSKDRFQYLQESKLKIDNVKEEGGIIKFTVDVTDGLDALYLFHAGVNCGMGIIRRVAA